MTLALLIGFALSLLIETFNSGQSPNTFTSMIGKARIIGNKDEFAIEYKVTETSQMLGFAKIWIQSQFYGTSEDLIYLKSYLYRLVEDLLNAEPINIDTSGLDTGQIYERLNFLNTSCSKIQIASSTFTDDFIGYKYSINDEIIMIWKIRDDVDMIFDDLRDYDKSIKSAKFSKYLGRSIFNELKNEIEITEQNSS